MSELIFCMEKESNLPPLQVVEHFRDQMQDYSRLSGERNDIFSTACDLSEKIIGLLS